MAVALSLGERGRGQTGLNPSVGCILVKDARIIGRGWTQPGGRPHAEAMALLQAGESTKGSTAYITLEPCAHVSIRGPACADSLIEAGVARVVVAIHDPDLRTAGSGIAKLTAAGIMVESGLLAAQAQTALAGYLLRQREGRPLVTLKLATSLDGCIALSGGVSKWITSEAARAHGHLERARSDAILVGGGTLRADRPSLNVRLAGLENRSPARIVLTSYDAPDGWHAIRSPADIFGRACNHLLIEGGAMTASAFLKAGLVDRLLLYRAPLLIGVGKPCLNEIGLTDLAAAHGQWVLQDSRMLGPDRMELYVRQQKA
jgi:diaminohydroxyphosphoribosylaminopyrimidine deaminase / 5-amino-6-(5-phosphoribosylamino)uracil reductase